MTTATPQSGRRAQAAHNDAVILEAARAVFIADADAPIAQVAERAGVGISALYRRYPSKEALLRRLCEEGLARYIAAAEAALADEGDAWTAFSDFMQAVVEADTHSLTLALAGTFAPTEALSRDAEQAHALTVRLFDRTRAAGAVRPDLTVDDLSFLFEQLAALRMADAARTGELRRRYLALLLEAVRGPATTPLPGPPPTWEEIGRRWER